MKLKYYRFGGGSRPFLIIPGLSVQDIFGAAEAVRTAFASFAQDYTVYLMDRREDVPENFSIRAMAGDIADTMRALGLADADVFGASQGGMIAQCLAIDHPELVHKLVLGSTLARTNRCANAAVRHWIDLAQRGDAAGLMRSFAELVYSVPVSVDETVTPEELKRFVRIARCCLDFDIYEELDSIRCPVLVLGARHDRVLTGMASVELAEKLGCECYMYEQFGHGVYDEAPDYRSRMLAFLRKL